MEEFLTRSMVDLILAAMHQHTVSGDYSGPLYGCYVALAKAGPSPSIGVTLADYTECDYTGYARQALGTPGTAFSQNGREKIVYPSLQFTPSDAVTPNTVSHILIVSAVTAGTLRCVIPISGGYPLPDEDSALVYVPEFGLKGDESVADGTIIV